MMPIETDRLVLREMTQDDLPALCAILCDADVMRTAYETPFTPDEAQAWLDRHRKRYETFGFGLWAVVLKQTGNMIGQCGLTWQDWRSEPVLEIGYLFQKTYWHNGFAAEAAAACREYAFTVLKADKVCSIVRDSNIPAQNVARRTGMQLADTDTKIFRGIPMRFHLCSVERNG